MYTLLNNSDASKFDLYLPGKLVASLHYTVAPNEIMFVYCESIEPEDADRHCRELMRMSVEDTLNRRIPITVSCPIASRFISADPRLRAQLPIPTKNVGHKHHS